MRGSVCVAVLAVACAGVSAEAKSRKAEAPTHAFDDQIAELSKRHNVPERLIHRVIMRESRYNAAAVHAGNYGLMQIRYGTARTMGYSGTPMGLCDGKTNLTYAVPYLANAYALAGRDEDRAVRLYASGFYYLAKRQGALSRLQVADARTEPPTAYVQAAPVNPLAALFGVVTAPAQAAVDAAQAEGAANLQAMAAAYQVAGEDAEVPLPPRRPNAYSSKAFVRLAMQQDAQADAAADTAQTTAAPTVEDAAPAVEDAAPETPQKAAKSKVASRAVPLPPRRLAGI